MIDPKLLNDSEFIVDLHLSQLRLFKDGELDWFLLIPRLDNIKEWIDLSLEDQIQLTKEIDYVSNLVREHSRPDKINIASIGNIVSQMHIHIIARYKTDRAWPATIWGTQSKQKLNDKRVDYWKDIVNQATFVH